MTDADLPLSREQVEAIRAETAELLADLAHEDCGDCDVAQEVVALCDTALAHEAQIDKLANFIMAEVEGEPSESEGAVDTAIRVIRALTEERDRLEEDYKDMLAAEQMHLKKVVAENRRLREALRPFAEWIDHVKDLGLIEAYPSGLQAYPESLTESGTAWLDVGRFWDAHDALEADDAQVE